MHEKPDADTIGSSLALARGLWQKGIKSRLYSRDRWPKPFQYLIADEVLEPVFTAELPDTVVVIDCGDLRRTGYPAEVSEFAERTGRLIHIDHHSESDLYRLANYRYFDPEAAATGEIIHRLLLCLEVEMRPEIAKPLFASLYYDTGGFRHANTDSQTLELAASLLSAGANLKELVRHSELDRSLAQLRLWGRALENSWLNEKYKLLISVLTLTDFDELEADPSEAAGLINLMNQANEASVALLIYETTDGLRGSLRTESQKIDLGELANWLGGGGLRRAAGFSLPARLVKESENWHIALS